MARPTLLDQLQRESADADDHGGQLGRAFAVLEAFADGAWHLSNVEIAAATGLPKSTVSRLTTQLARQGMLSFAVEQNRYRLGARVVNVARAFLGSRDVRAAARIPMEALAQRFGAPVALAERTALEMVYVEYFRGSGTVIVLREIGSRVPLVESAAGRAFMAAAGDEERAWLVDALSRRDRRETAGLQRIVDKARRELAAQGFATSFGEWHVPINAVAAPLRSAFDGSISCVSIAAPAALVPKRRFLAEFGPALVALTREVDAGQRLA